MSPSDSLDSFSVVSMPGPDDPISQLEQHIGFVARSSGVRLLEKSGHFGKSWWKRISQTTMVDIWGQLEHCK